MLETAGKLMELELKEKPLHMHVKGIRHFSNKVRIESHNSKKEEES